MQGCWLNRWTDITNLPSSFFIQSVSRRLHPPKKLICGHASPPQPQPKSAIQHPISDVLQEIGIEPSRVWILIWSVNGNGQFMVTGVPCFPFLSVAHRCFHGNQSFLLDPFFLSAIHCIGWTHFPSEIRVDRVSWIAAFFCSMSHHNCWNIGGPIGPYFYYLSQITVCSCRLSVQWVAGVVLSFWSSKRLLRQIPSYLSFACSIDQKPTNVAIQLNEITVALPVDQSRILIEGKSRLLILFSEVLYFLPFFVQHYHISRVCVCLHLFMRADIQFGFLFSQIRLRASKMQ